MIAKLTSRPREGCVRGRRTRRRVVALPIDITLEGESIRLLEVLWRRPLGCELGSKSHVLWTGLVFLSLYLARQPNVCYLGHPFARQLREGDNGQALGRLLENKPNQGSWSCGTRMLRLFKSRWRMSLEWRKANPSAIPRINPQPWRSSRVSGLGSAVNKSPLSTYLRFEENRTVRNDWEIVKKQE